MLLVVGVVVEVVVVGLLGWSLLGEDSVSTLESWLPIIINNNNIYIGIYYKTQYIYIYIVYTHVIRYIYVCILIMKCILFKFKLNKPILRFNH